MARTHTRRLSAKFLALHRPTMQQLIADRDLPQVAIEAVIWRLKQVRGPITSDIIALFTTKDVVSSYLLMQQAAMRANKQRLEAKASRCLPADIRTIDHAQILVARISTQLPATRRQEHTLLRAAAQQLSRELSLPGTT